MPPKLIRLIRVFIRDMDSEVMARAKISCLLFKARTGRKKNLGEWFSEAGQEKLEREEQAEKA